MGMQVQYTETIIALDMDVGKFVIERFTVATEYIEELLNNIRFSNAC